LGVVGVGFLRGFPAVSGRGCKSCEKKKDYEKGGKKGESETGETNNLEQSSLNRKTCDVRSYARSGEERENRLIVNAAPGKITGESRLPRIAVTNKKDSVMETQARLGMGKAAVKVLQLASVTEEGRQKKGVRHPNKD